MNSNFFKLSFYTTFIEILSYSQVLHCKYADNVSCMQTLAKMEKLLKILSPNPLPPSDAVQKQKKNILDDLFGSVLSHFKKISPLWKPEI